MDPSESPSPKPDGPPDVVDRLAPDSSFANPYAPAQVTPAQVTPAQVTPAQVTPAQVTPAQVTPAQVAQPKAPPGLRWWTPLAISAVSLGVFMAASLVMFFVAVVVVHGALSIEILRNPDSLHQVSQSRIGLLILVVIPQFALVIPSLVAAVLSPVPTRRRLGLVRGHWPLWAWLAAAVATPLIGMASGLVVGMFLEESDSLKQMTQIFREHGKNGFLIPLAIMIGATPAFCEELLFRGYVQTRLVRSFGPVAGIVVASFLFAAFHLDIVHVVAVFPLGLFLGWITWQSGSLFPAMMGHFVNNVISVVAVVVAPEDNPDVLALPAMAFTFSILGLGILGMASVLVASVVYGKPRNNELPTMETATGPV